jgi:hypothetical protein
MREHSMPGEVIRLDGDVNRLDGDVIRLPASWAARARPAVALRTE